MYYHGYAWLIPALEVAGMDTRFKHSWYTQIQYGGSLISHLVGFQTKQVFDKNVIGNILLLIFFA